MNQLQQTLDLIIGKIDFHREEIRKLEAAASVIAGFLPEDTFRPDHTEAKISPSKAIVDLLGNSNKPLRSSAIAERLGIPRNKVWSTLYHLKKTGVVTVDGKGAYTK